VPDQPSFRRPRLSTPQLTRLLDALALAPDLCRHMAEIAYDTDDTPDGWLALTPAQAAEVVNQALARFDRRAA
jgi:hypothetical protein